MAELTICMPVYNGERHLAESVGSILGQSFSDFVMLCYDDGSTDRSVDVLKSFNDDRIRIINGGENRGGVYARSQLIGEVGTEYCMWLDDDDRYCRQDAVEHAMKSIRSNGFDMVNFVRIREIDADGNVSVTKPLMYGDFEYCGDLLFEKFYPTDNHFIFNSKIFRTEILKGSVPGEDILSRRFCTDDVFFSAMWFFHARRYLNIASDEPMYEYKKSIGVWGSNTRNVSPKRIGDLCILQYNVLVSLYNRMVSERSLSNGELSSLVKGVNFPMVARAIKSARSAYGDKYADNLMDIWHTAFGKDGVHLLNGINIFEMSGYVRWLEGLMK